MQPRRDRGSHDLLMASAGGESVHARATRRGADRCPYCHEPFSSADDSDGAQRVACTGCGTPHHAECFAENGGCSALGCERIAARVPSGAALTAEDLRPGWRDRTRPRSVAIPLIVVGFALLTFALATDRFPLLGPLFIALGIGVSLLNGMRLPTEEAAPESPYTPPFPVPPNQAPANGYEGARLLVTSSRRRMGERLSEPSGPGGECHACGRALEATADLAFCYHCGASLS